MATAMLLHCSFSCYVLLPVHPVTSEQAGAWRTLRCMLYCCAAATSSGLQTTSMSGSITAVIASAAAALSAAPVLPPLLLLLRVLAAADSLHSMVANGKVSDGGRPPCMPMIPGSLVYCAVMPAAAKQLVRVQSPELSHTAKAVFVVGCCNLCGMHPDQPSF
eukprot:GHRR01025114.1.p1 GENE.GHRR01025114.1~~GHRR01025114.1.p1  ORF type:complete len:162 (-),score=55.87 GHRR01025114.1:446-931(-)